MSGNKKITLDDVAQIAGVSSITVSRALRQPEKVSEAVRARVDSAVARLGYVPNPAARILASGRSDVIGVIIPSITNNVFSDVLRGIYDGIEGTAYDVQLGNTRYSPLQEDKLLRVFASQKPAGLIVTGLDQTPKTRAFLAALDCPVVQMMETGSEPVDLCVGFSHYEAAKAATEHLIAQGYRRPAFLGARMDPRTQRRLAGFRAATEAAGLYDEIRVITTTTPSSVTIGTQLLSELMARAPDADSVFCNNDDLALGALFEAQRRRLAVPAQFGICGFNDLEFTAAAEPPITSVRTHRYRMGLRAVELIKARLSGAEIPDRIVDLGFQIQPRGSTVRNQVG